MRQRLSIDGIRVELQLQQRFGNSDTSSSSAPNTDAQDAIDRSNQQAASDASNAAAQQQFLAGMAAAQETEK